MFNETIRQEPNSVRSDAMATALAARGFFAGFARRGERETAPEQAEMTFPLRGKTWRRL